MSDGEHSPAWRPETGDVLTGVVEDLVTLNVGWGPYVAVVVRQDDGTRLAWHSFHRVGALELARLRPEVGERICVTYTGRHKPKAENGAAWHGYRVSMPDRPAGGAVDWDAISKCAAHEPAHVETRPNGQLSATDELPF